VYICVFYKIKNFVVVSSLNGNNGEWTNGDDRPVNEVDYSISISIPEMVVDFDLIDTINRLIPSITFDRCPECGFFMRRVDWYVTSIFCRGCRLYYGCHEEGTAGHFAWSRLLEAEDSEDTYDNEVLLRDSCENGSVNEPFNLYPLSQINGNNGEWTNGDDVPPDKRVKKEARNKMLHASTTPHKKKTGQEPKINKPCRDYIKGNCTRDNCKFNHDPADIPPPLIPDEESDDEEEEKPKRVIRKVNEENFYIVDKGRIEFVLPEKEDIIFDCYKTTSYVQIPKFTHFKANLGGQVEGPYLVHDYFYEALVDKLGILPDESRNYAACFRAVRELLAGATEEVKRGTFVFYCYKNSLRAVPNECQQALINTRSSFACGQVTVIPTEPSPQAQYRWNMAWKIVKSEGFSMDFDRQGNVIRYPEFKTNKRISEGPRNKRAFFRFMPVNQFMYYATTGQNVCRAMARYFKCRNDQEEEMVSRQLALLRDFDLDVIDDCAKLCGARFTYTPMPLSEDSDVFEPQPCYMLESRKMTVETGKPSRSRCFLAREGTGNFSKVLRHIGKQSCGGILEQIRDHIRSGFESIFNGVIEYVYSPIHWLYDRSEILRSFVKLPHPKRLLYSQYVLDDKTLDKILSNEGEFESKFKWEAGKVGKVGRLYATAGHLCLADNVGADVLKKAFTRPIDLAEVCPTTKSFGVEDHFSTPPQFIVEFCDCQEASQSDALFKKASQLSEGSFAYYYFSDDGFAVHKYNGRTYVYETDISSCDASNGFAIFASVKQLAKLFKLGFTVDMLLAQCARCTTVHNPCEYTEYVRLLCLFFFEFSGSRLTSVLNNIASVAIALGAYELLCLNGDISFTEALIQGALRYGWVLEVAPKESFNAVTFLKRAYNGKRSWKVYGCILRSFGITDGEPCAASFGVTYSEFKLLTDSQKTELLIRQLANSLVNEPGSLLINAVRERAGLSLLPEEVSILDLQERYGGSLFEWEMLRSSILDLSFGDVVRLPILELIYSVDYGVKPVYDDTLNPSHLEKLPAQLLF